MNASGIIGSYQNAQAQAQQRALVEQQIAASRTAQEATQRQIDATDAGNQQAALALQGSLLDPEQRALIEADPALRAQVHGVVGDFGRGPGGKGTQTAQAPTALSAFEGKRQQALQANAFRAYRESLALDPANADLLPRVDALSKMVVGSGFTPEQALDMARMAGLPRDQVERLNIQIAETNLRAAGDRRQSDAIATAALVRQGLLPQGTAQFEGASEWVRTLSVLDRQHAQNRALQAQAHNNALAVEAERAKNAFATAFTRELIDLIPVLARPFEDAMGNPVQRSPKDIADYVDGLARQYGVELPRAQERALQGALQEATLLESAALDFADVMRQPGFDRNRALAGLRQQLGAIENIQTETINRIMGEVMRRYPTVMPPNRAHPPQGALSPAPQAPAIAPVMGDPQPQGAMSGGIQHAPAGGPMMMPGQRPLVPFRGAGGR